MKRYILFSYDAYYPCGAMEDEEERFNTMEECNDYIKNMPYKSDYNEVLDLQTGEWIEIRESN